MEAINWLAVIVGGGLAGAVSAVWSGPRRGRSRNYGAALIVMLIGALMLGHSFARIGSATLAAKPWLYFMQSGGIALAFIIPAVWLVSARGGVAMRERVADCLRWLAAYLVIGAAFWALA